MLTQSFISKLYNLAKSSSVLFCTVLLVGNLLDASQRFLVDFKKPLTMQDPAVLYVLVRSVNTSYPLKKSNQTMPKPVTLAVNPTPNVCPPWPD